MIHKAKVTCKMIAHRKGSIMTLLTLALCITAEAKIECTHKYGGVIECSQNKSNFKLRKGDGYYNNRTSELTLRACHISAIEKDAFEYMPLKHLDLAENEIKELPETIFHQIGMDMNFLNMSFNKLKNLSKDIFKNMIVLEVLDLKMNHLYLITPEIFDPLQKLKYLDLSDNNLVGRGTARFAPKKSNASPPPCDLLRGLESLEFLSVENNNLIEIPCFATAETFKALRYLILTKNQLVSLDNPDTFSKLPKMQSLEIGENLLEHLHEELFKPMNKLHNIVLRFNKLKSIPNTLFQGLNSLMTVDLSYNEISMLHANMFNGTRTDTLIIVGNKMKYLPVNFCSDMRNAGAQIRYLYFNDNPWDCACLDELMAEVNSLKIEYDNHKFNATEPRCDAGNQSNASTCARVTNVE